MSTAKLPYKRNSRGDFLVPLADIVRHIYRPVNDKQVELYSDAILKTGYDAKFPVVCYVGEDGKLHSLTGEHRMRACERAAYALDIPVAIEDDPGSESARLARATQLNAHLPTDVRDLARIIVSYCNAYCADNDTKTPPKPSVIATSLRASESYTRRIVTNRSKACPELRAAFVTAGSPITPAIFEKMSEVSHKEQRERLEKNDFSFPEVSKKPPLGADFIPRLAHLRPVFAGGGLTGYDLLVTMLTHPELGEREKAHAALMHEVEKSVVEVEPEPVPS